MVWRTPVQSNTHLLFGKKEVRNTHLPFDMIFEKLSSKINSKELLEICLEIYDSDNQVCLLSASKMFKHKKIIGVA